MFFEHGNLRDFDWTTSSAAKVRQAGSFVMESLMMRPLPILPNITVRVCCRMSNVGMLTVFMTFNQDRNSCKMR